MKKENMKNTITEHLLVWYKKNKRDLPWRRTKDPYAILVSEMMLQQTQVGTVIDYYHRFLSWFPDFETLAAASEQDVLAAWQGLGYYSRARNLHALAKRVVSEYGGKLPKDAEHLRKLPGIGDYMCGAVMSIAFEKPYPAVDGNVLRVVSRVLDMHEDIAKTTTRKAVEAHVSEWIPEDASGDFTQALMELGALVCKPKNPDCESCPLSRYCAARARGTIDMLPVKTAKKKPITEAYFVLLIEAENGVLMQKREEGGLLAGMWGLPMVVKRLETDIDTDVRCWLGTAPRFCQVLGDTIHVFTHRRWEMTVVHCGLDRKREGLGGEWYPLSKISDLPVPVAFKKAIGMLGAKKRKKSEDK